MWLGMEDDLTSVIITSLHNALNPGGGVILPVLRLPLRFISPIKLPDNGELCSRSLLRGVECVGLIFSEDVSYKLVGLLRLKKG